VIDEFLAARLHHVCCVAYGNTPTSLVETRRGREEIMGACVAIVAWTEKAKVDSMFVGSISRNAEKTAQSD
jgi:hypothetical protein